MNRRGVYQSLMVSQKIFVKDEPQTLVAPGKFRYVKSAPEKRDRFVLTLPFPPGSFGTRIHVHALHPIVCRRRPRSSLVSAHPNPPRGRT